MGSANKQKFTIREISLIGMLAALVLVGTFIKIDIPTPLGKTMLHMGNTVCILAGLLFGPVIGGLAAGLGSMFFDLFDPIFAPEFWITFIMKFIMAFVAGLLANFIKKKKLSHWLYIIVCLLANLTYTLVFLTKEFIVKYLILDLEIETVIIDLTVKATASFASIILTVIASYILFSLLLPVLKRAKVFDNIKK